MSRIYRENWKRLVGDRNSNDIAESGNILIGSDSTKWESTLITGTWSTNHVTYNAIKRRVRDSLDLSVGITIDDSAALSSAAPGALRLTLPDSLNIDTDKIPGGVGPYVGDVYILSVGVQVYFARARIFSTTSIEIVANRHSVDANYVTSWQVWHNFISFADGDKIAIRCIGIPIDGWL